jgi:hypothetical protein
MRNETIISEFTIPAENIQPLFAEVYVSTIPYWDNKIMMNKLIQVDLPKWLSRVDLFFS